MKRASKCALLLSTILAGALASRASAQVIYEPVQVPQPAFASASYPYLMQTFNLPPGVSLFSPAGPQYVQPRSTGNADIGVYAPSLVMGNAPYDSYALTPDAARNVAYAQVPLYQPPIVPPAAPAAAEPAAEPQPVTGGNASSAANISPRDKAIPLLDWAKAERTRNPLLYRALVDKARTLDSAATANFEREVASER